MIFKNFGGVETLAELCEEKGEEQAVMIISLLGYSLNSGESKEEKSSIKRKEKTLEVDKQMKEAVNEYLIGHIKKRFPNLSTENEEIFKEGISPVIDYEMKHGNHYGGFGPRGLHCDNQPSPELLNAFMNMDFGPEYPDIRMSAACYSVFPMKMSVRIERGKYVEATDGYLSNEYLFMTKEYSERALNEVDRRIQDEIAKIPKKTMLQFQEEHKKELEEYQEERKPLLKKKEARDKLLEKETVFREKSDRLVKSYLRRLNEIDKMPISDEEKRARKEQVKQETALATEEFEKFSRHRQEEEGKLNEKYGYNTLDTLDAIHENANDEETWMRNRILDYAKEENNRIFEEFDWDEAWEMSRNVPSSDLQSYYEDRDAIRSYIEKEKAKTEAEENKEQEEQKVPNLDEHQTQIVSALAEAYSDYVAKGEDYNCYVYVDDEEQQRQQLKVAIQDYLSKTIDNILDAEFMEDFMTEKLPEIASQYSFNKKVRDKFLFGYGLNRRIDSAVKYEDGIIIGSQGSFSKKVYYGDIETVDRKIEELRSKEQFFKDYRNDGIRGISYKESMLLEALQDYKTKEQLKGKSLSELDREKAKLEDIERNAMDLLKEFEKQFGISDDKDLKPEGPSFDDE